MRASLRKTVVGSLAALAFGVSTLVSVAPALAQAPPQHPHGPAGHGYAGQPHRYGGGGGGGHWNNGVWVPAAIGLGILGLAAGAAAAANGGYYPDDGCQQYRPIYDPYGNYMGRRLVNVC